MTSNQTGVTASSGCTVPGREGADELARRAQQGDAGAFDELMRAFARPMYNLAFRMTGSWDDADDLTQEIFVKLYRSIRSFNWKSSFSTWFYALASNTCRSGLRKTRRIAKREVVHLDARDESGENPGPPEPADPGAGPDEQVRRRETARMVNEAIGGLDEDARMVLVLRDLQGLEYEEIAEALGCNLGTVKSRLHRARMKLKDRLVREEGWMAK